MKIKNISEEMFLFFTAVTFSFFTATLGRELYLSPYNALPFLATPRFVITFTLLAAVSFAVFRIMAVSSPRRNAPPVILSAGLMFSSFILFLIKFTNIYSMCLNNIFFALTLVLFIFFLNPALPDPEKNKKFILPIVCLSVVLGLLSFIRTLSYYDAYRTMTDMALHINAIWQYSTGSLPVSWLEGSLGITHRIGIHFQPVIYLFAAFYKFFPFPQVLLFIQSMSAFGGIIFIYLLCEKVLKNADAAFFLALAFAVSPFLAQAVDYDFHFDFIYFTALPAFLYFAESGMFWPAAASLAVGISCKEEAAVYMTFASVFAMIRTKDKKYVILALISAVYSIVVIFYLMPSFNAYDATHADKTLGLISSAAGIFTPDIMGQFIICYLAGVVFAPLCPAAALLLIFAPPVAVHLLNTLNWSKLFFYQYHAFTLTALFVTSIYGLDRVRGKIKPLYAAFTIFAIQVLFHAAYAPALDSAHAAVIPLILFIAVPFVILYKKIAPFLKPFLISAAVALVFFTGYYTFNSFRGYIDPALKRNIDKAVSMLPRDPDVPVIAEANICSHISNRKYITDPAFYHGSNYMILNRISRVRAKEFYMLYGGTKTAVMDEIRDLSVKFGYKYREVYSNGPVKLLTFY